MNTFLLMYGVSHSDGSELCSGTIKLDVNDEMLEKIRKDYQNLSRLILIKLTNMISRRAKFFDYCK